MNNTFMAVAMDTYDEEGGNNPRYKQIVAERLAISGGNVAYGLTAQPTNGPYPTSIVFHALVVWVLVQQLHAVCFIRDSL